MGFNFVLVFSPGTFADFPHNLSATVNMPADRTGAVMRALLAALPVGVGHRGRRRVDTDSGRGASNCRRRLPPRRVAILAGIAVLSARSRRRARCGPTMR